MPPRPPRKRAPYAGARAKCPRIRPGTASVGYAAQPPELHRAFCRSPGEALPPATKGGLRGPQFGTGVARRRPKDQWSIHRPAPGRTPGQREGPSEFPCSRAAGETHSSRSAREAPCAARPARKDRKARGYQHRGWRISPSRPARGLQATSAGRGAQLSAAPACLQARGGRQACHP